MRTIIMARGRRLAPVQDVQPELTQLGEPEIVSLSEYWRILVKRRRLIILLFCLVFGAGAYFALSATALYTASATVKIEPQNPQVTGISEVQPLEFRGEYDYYQTQFALLQSRRLAARVISVLGLENNQKFLALTVISPNPLDHVKAWMGRLVSYTASLVSALLRPRRQQGTDSSTDLPAFGAADIELQVPDHIINQYLGFLAIAPVKQTRLVRVQFTTPSPELSQVFANAHVESFMRMSLESRFSLTKEAREFLDQKKAELRERLEKSEGAINEFRRAHGVLSVEKGENIVVDRLLDLNRQLTVARAQRIEAESLHKTVENRNNRDLAEIMKQGLVQQLRNSIAGLEAEKVRLGTIFKPDHPKIQDLNQQLNAARQALNNEIVSVVDGIRSGYNAALAKERALQSEADRQQQDALRLKELGVNYTVLQEEVNANRSLYESVLKRLSETNVSKDLAVSNMQISERAAKPLFPSGPNVSLYLFASMFSGLLLGVGTAFLREFCDSTVGSPETVWRAVGLATLGVIPQLNSFHPHSGPVKRLVGRPETRQRSSGKSLLVTEGHMAFMGESYRGIRTSLLLSRAESPARVILLTSPSPGEGKTLTSVNLAIVLAQDGHSVLLVDGDLRRGRCHAPLGLNSGPGLANIAAGDLRLEESLQSSPVSGLTFLARGTLPPNPSELLGSQRMKNVLGELKEKFEFILIDSPPVMALTDAAVLSVLSDGVLLVLDGQKTSVPNAQRAVERLDMVNARILGVILNGVNLDDPQYSYHYDYYSYLPPHRNGDHAEPAPYCVPPNGGANGGQIAAKPGGNGYKHEFGSRATSDDIPFVGTVLSNKSRKMVEDGVVSEVLMNRLLAALVNAVGPVAPLILRDHIALLGESQNEFPRERVPELVSKIEPEILTPELRARFRQEIAHEIDRDSVHH
jgi:succinoglycan biosynthesis transport protein ExoP